MSKAFKSSDGEENLNDELPDPQLQIPSGAKNYITPSGAKKLREELHHLLHEERPRVTQVVSWAASNGDRSENADYQYGKRRLREIDRRIRFLTKRLDIAEIIDPSHQKSDSILFGATVKILNEAGERKTYQIVGIDETEVKAGKISWISPLGKALIGKKQGDVVYVQTPGGEQEIEILEVGY